MKKLCIVLLVLLTVTVVFGWKYASGTEEKLADILEVDAGQVTKISVLTPFLSNKPKYTTDKQDIENLVNYFDGVTYKRVRGDVSSYMPMKASIVYFYQNEEVDFLIPYEKEIMIDRRVYQIKDGRLSEDYLQDYYRTLE